MRSPTLLPMRMNAADTSASRAMTDCTPLTVVSRSRTTDEIETFISDVSTTSTNIAMASKMASRGLRGCFCGGTVGLDRLHQLVVFDLALSTRLPKLPRAASRIRRTTTARKIRSHSIWAMTATRAGSAAGVMSPKPTVENTVTVK
jgi:hypothetical protein